MDAQLASFSSLMAIARHSIRALDTLRRTKVVESHVANLKAVETASRVTINSGLTTHWNGRAISKLLFIDGNCAPFNSSVRHAPKNQSSRVSCGESQGSGNSVQGYNRRRSNNSLE